MTIAFWGSVALLLAGAMLFVLPPLLRPPVVKRGVASPMEAYRDQRAQIDEDFAQGTLTREQHAQALAELQTRVVQEVGDVETPAPARHTPQSTAFIVAVALLIPAGALALYGILGTPTALKGGDASTVASRAEQAPHPVTQEEMEAMVEGLAQKLKQNPNDAAGWHMLARSYAAFNRLPEAAQAYDKANALSPGDPQILADYADVLAMVNGRSLEGRPTQLVMEALKADPKHQKSLALAGTAAFNRGEFAKAADWWKQLLATLPPGSEPAKAVQSNIAQAEAGGKDTGGSVMAAAPAAPSPAAQPMQRATATPATTAAPAANAAAGATVEGSVTLADAVKAGMAPGSVLFIYARPADGSRMPLAILRQEAGSFPVRFKLDDSLAMAPQAKLSLHSQVMLVARISRSGNATPQPGDITGSLGPVKVGTRDLKLVINEVVK
jgi:cytochrome c-type biogenesis protein CcmH